MPGHGMSIDDQSSWAVMKAGFDAAGSGNVTYDSTPHYITVPADSTQGISETKACIVKVKITNTNAKFKNKDFYFGMQIDSASQIESAHLSHIRKPKDAELKMDCAIGQAASYPAIIWLK
jgi:hypothetical protein